MGQLRAGLLSIVTFGAYIGGYHWTQIVIEPVLYVGKDL
jgi:hypothetical protein